MFANYLVTGATGFLGLTVVRMLAARGERVTALVLKGDTSAARLPAGVRVSYGDVSDRNSLADFFSPCDEHTCVIHCAGMVSIRTTPGRRLRAINVTGTANIVALCQAHRAGRLIYVSSVHAIPEAKKGAVTTEAAAFSPKTVSGPYAKSKAEASALVLAAAKNGLNACIVHPSGIVGPEDYNLGSVSSMIISYCRGRLPLGVEGGYDFVDVRDVASGILACCERGVPGECYILSSEYVTIRTLLRHLQAESRGKRVRAFIPTALAKILSPFAEGFSLLRREKPCFTPYSVAVLASNGHFSHAKATRELGYAPRKFSDTLRDTFRWLREKGYC